MSLLPNFKKFVIQSLRESTEEDDLVSLGLGTNMAQSVYDKVMSHPGVGHTHLEDYLFEPENTNVLRFAMDWLHNLDELEHIGVDGKEHRRRNQGITIEDPFGGEIIIDMDFDNKVFLVSVTIEQNEMRFFAENDYEIQMNDLLSVDDNSTAEDYANELISTFELFDHMEDPFGVWYEIEEAEKEAIEQHKNENAQMDDEDDDDEDDDDDDEDDDVNEKKKLKFHHSDAPDAKGKFKELGVQKLADWLIRTRGGNMQKITGSLNQQINFNKRKNPSYAKKMESTREAVKRKLAKRKNK